MNFARAWLSRLIRLAKTGLWATPFTKSPQDRLQAAREENGRFVSRHRIEMKAKARAMRAAFGLPPHPSLEENNYV